ncbi:MAG: RNA polymerase sigma factor [Anaerolinea sp.]|nr:RNA polymerase sigma factor [Anaerolinea sp.]
MPIEEDDPRLIARIRQGDQEAFGDLYERYLDDIYRYVYYRVSNHQDAEDLTEQVFLKAWEGMHGYRSQVPFRAWIYRIAHNAIIDHYRTRKGSLPLTEHTTLIDKNPDPEKQLMAKDKAEQLACTINRLSPLHQHVLILRFINGFSMTEVAQILDRNVGAIRVLQHRALKAMQAFLTAGEITDV